MRIGRQVPLSQHLRAGSHAVEKGNLLRKRVAMRIALVATTKKQETKTIKPLSRRATGIASGYAVKRERERPSKEPPALPAASLTNSAKVENVSTSLRLLFVGHLRGFLVRERLASRSTLERDCCLRATAI